ncbi:MAG: hypothetical protein HZB38_15980 [Planctomycetes bacterium]|nr:hypothetical protein [Planctomycetota bacterium]
MVETAPSVDLEAIRERYRAVRALCTDWSHEMIRLLGKAAIDVCAKRLGMFRHGVLMCGDEAEMYVLFDFMLYDYRDRDGRNAVQRYLRAHPPADDSLEQELARAMGAARYEIITVRQTHPGFGLDVVSVGRQQQFFLADLALSRSAPIGGCFASRLLHFAGFSATTGASVLMTQAALLLVTGELERRRFDPARDPAAFSELIIRAGQQSGSTEMIAYKDAAS